MKAERRIKIVDVGPRDGLQNEKSIVPAAIKVELIHRLAAAGVPVIEATSFVAPRRIPQLADAAEVMAALKRAPGVRYPVLVPNLAGLGRALAAGAREIAVFTAASDAFNRKNINCDISGSLARIGPVVAHAREKGVSVRGYVSCVLGCPYQGAVEVSEVVRLAKCLFEMGCEEISLGDTIGVGTPEAARRMFRACRDALPVERLAVHFHDTRGQALANAWACIEEGGRIVDGSIAGLGGCPYAEGASGNLATEDLVEALHGMGFETGVDLDALRDIACWISAQLGHQATRKARQAAA